MEGLKFGWSGLNEAGASGDGCGHRDGDVGSERSENTLSISAICRRNEIRIFSNRFSTKELHRLIRRIIK